MSRPDCFGYLSSRTVTCAVQGICPPKRIVYGPFIRCSDLTVSKFSVRAP